jgi:site-specific DNA-methyltransferase (adenine-specific)
VLPRLPEAAFDVVYIDPPFNTGSTRTLARTRAERRPDGASNGFGGHRYTREVVSALSYCDVFDDFVEFIAPKLVRARELLAEHGTLYFHIDYREAHYCKVLLDGVFGRECFLNEIIWAYDYGARTKRRWPAKHDTILVYVKDPKRYWFDGAEVDREPYMAPGLQTAERAAEGKLPTDVWWHTIVPTSGRERTGYPTQKPEGVVRRMVAASSRPGGWCLDFFAGSGTLGAVAAGLGRRFVLVDENPEAIAVMRERLAPQPMAPGMLPR